MGVLQEVRNGFRTTHEVSTGRGGTPKALVWPTGLTGLEVHNDRASLITSFLLFPSPLFHPAVVANLI